MSEKKRSKVLKRISASVFFLLVLYVLSIGPVSLIYMDESGKVPAQHSENLKTLYAPVVWAMKKNSWFASFMMNYVEACNKYR